MTTTYPTVVSTLPDGTTFSRVLMLLGAARGDVYRAQLMAAEWKGTPNVKATLEFWNEKAAVAPGTTTDATWAGPLSAYGTAREALALERGVSIIGQLAPKMRRVPFKTKVSRETGTARVARGLRSLPAHR